MIYHKPFPFHPSPGLPTSSSPPAIFPATPSRSLLLPSPFLTKKREIENAEIKYRGKKKWDVSYLVLGSCVGELRCERTKFMILCSPSPGTVASEMMTLSFSQAGSVLSLYCTQ